MIVALVVAAGLSRRMGRFKLTLPWDDGTVVGKVVATLEAAGVNEIVVVTGHRADEVVAALAGTSARIAFNPDYASGEMLSSIQAGLRALVAAPELKPPSERNKPGSIDSREPPSGKSAWPAALFCLGDQPQMESDTVRAVLAAGARTGWRRIVIPSYQMRAGHPILLPAWLWPEILSCAGTLRDVMAAHRDQTDYLIVETPSVLADLDTLQDYENARL